MANRGFGIELECYHPGQTSAESFQQVVDAINALGITAIRAPYTGTDFTVWQIKPDASLSSGRCAGRGIEIVSRFFKDGTDADLAEVRKVAEKLVELGFTVCRETGFHVHVSTPDVAPGAEHAAVSLRYNLLADQIKPILPRSRYDGVNPYAVFLSPSALDKVRRAVVDRSGATWGTLVTWTHGERYNPVNLEHAHKGRSERRIEFRQAAGTVDADKIVGWINFCRQFTTESVRIYREVLAAPTP